MYLTSMILIPKEIKHPLGLNWNPEGSGSTKHNTRRPAWIIHTLSGHYSHIIRTSCGQCRPCMCSRSTNSSAKTHHHSLGQLQHTFPPFSGCYHYPEEQRLIKILCHLEEIQMTKLFKL